MTTYTIIIENVGELGAFNFSADLNGIDFKLDFQFNSREGFWYFDLLDVGGTRLRSGIKVVSNLPLLRLFRDVLLRPEGELLCLDTRLEPTDPDLDGLNTTSIFSYADADTLAEVS